MWLSGRALPQNQAPLTTQSDNVLSTTAPTWRRSSGEQPWSLRRKRRLVCFSVGKMLQLQPFVLCESCWNLSPESSQMVCCTQNTSPPFTPSCSPSLQPSHMLGALRLPLLVEEGMALTLICSIITWGPLPVPCHFLKSCEHCQEKGKESPRVKAKATCYQTSPGEVGEVVADLEPNRPGKASVDYQVLSPGQSHPHNLYILFPVYLLWFFLNKTAIGMPLPDNWCSW